MNGTAGGASPLRALGCAYLEAKRAVVGAGYDWEIEWQRSVRLSDVSERTFLCEAAWVILCSGMRETIIRRYFGRISDAFLRWRSALAIVQERARCRRRALEVFRNSGKIDAILTVAQRVADDSFARVKAALDEVGTEYLRTFPFLGPATSLHLAKSLGLPVAKPDRHLMRIAHLFNYPSAPALCGDIAALVDESVGVVDVVLWRYATLHPDYRQLLASEYRAALAACA